jgi:hypothetical protein
VAAVGELGRRSDGSHTRLTLSHGVKCLRQQRDALRRAVSRGNVRGAPGSQGGAPDLKAPPGGRKAGELRSSRKEGGTCCALATARERCVAAPPRSQRCYPDKAKRGALNGGPRGLSLPLAAMWPLFVRTQEQLSVCKGCLKTVAGESGERLQSRTYRLRPTSIGGEALTRGESRDGVEPVSPELVLVDPDLAGRLRGSPGEHAAASGPGVSARTGSRRLRAVLVGALAVGAVASIGAAVPSPDRPASAPLGLLTRPVTRKGQQRSTVPKGRLISAPCALFPC